MSGKTTRNQRVFTRTVRSCYIVLGRRDEMLNTDPNADPDAAYPAIKVTDFGLAEITLLKNDEDNPASFFGPGTTHFKPPVCLTLLTFTQWPTADNLLQEQRHFGIEWNPHSKDYDKMLIRPVEGAQGKVAQPYQADIDPQGQPRPMHKVDKPDDWFKFEGRYADSDELAEQAAEVAGLKFGPEFNVWAFGKIMYDLLTLSESFSLDEVMGFYDQGDYRTGNLVDLLAVMGDEKPPQYLDLLCTLVAECLNPEKGYRPTPEELVEVTRVGLTDTRTIAIANEKPRGGGEDPVRNRLYFRAGETPDPDGVADDAPFPALFRILGGRAFLPGDQRRLPPIQPAQQAAPVQQAPLPAPVHPIQPVQPAQLPPPQTPPAGPGAQQPFILQAPLQPAAGARPTKADYMQMRLAEAEDELWHRGINPTLLRTRTRKGYAARLGNADGAGNRGRGVYRQADLGAQVGRGGRGGCEVGGRVWLRAEGK